MRALPGGIVIVLLSAALARPQAPVEVLDLPVRSSAEPPRPLRTVIGTAPAVLSFWASYCPPCRAEVPVLRRAESRWRVRGVRVIGVALGFADPVRVARVAREWGIDYEVYWVADEEERVARLLPKGLPATFLVRPGSVSRHDRLLLDADIDTLVPPLIDGPPTH